MSTPPTPTQEASSVEKKSWQKLRDIRQHIKNLTIETSLHTRVNTFEGGDDWTTKAAELNDDTASKKTKKKAYDQLKASVDNMAARVQPIEDDMRTLFLEGALDTYVRQTPVGFDEHGKLPAVYEKQDWEKLQTEAKMGMKNELASLQALVDQWRGLCDRYALTYGTKAGG
jgi:hypothetical protein